MKKILILVLGLFILFPHSAEAQSQRNPCYYNTPLVGSGNGCNNVSNQTPLPVQVQPPQSSISGITNCSGTIGTGGTAQPLFTAAQYKTGFILEIGANDSNIDSLYFSDGATTTTPAAADGKSWSIGPSTSTVPGGSFTSPSNFPVGVAYFINGATTGDKYKCRVW